MQTNTRSLLASLSLLSAVAAFSTGCVHAATMEVPNPVTSKQVPSNAIPFPRPYAEAAHGLPGGTLTDEAALLSVDNDKICFKLTLRSDGARADLAKPGGWRVFLRGKPEFEDMTPEITDEGDPEEKTMQGYETLASSAHQQVCDGEGHCYDRNITTTARIPAEIKVETGKATVCFQNKGHLTGITEEMTLHLDDRTPQLSANQAQPGMFGAWGGGQRVAFRWKFD
jgi:hypothetical protein